MICYPVQSRVDKNKKMPYNFLVIDVKEKEEQETNKS